MHFLQVWLTPKIGGEPRYAEKALAESAKRNHLALMLSGERRDGVISIRADADVYFGVLDAGKQLVHRPSPGRALWLHVIAGEVSVSGERFTPGDGASFENFSEVEINAVRTRNSSCSI